MFTHGDDYFICDYCGSRLDVNKYSSGGLFDMVAHGWKYYIINEQSNYKFLKNSFKNPNPKSKVILKCDLCIRKEKINKIYKRVQK